MAFAHAWQPRVVVRSSTPAGPRAVSAWRCKTRLGRSSHGQRIPPAASVPPGSPHGICKHGVTSTNSARRCFPKDLRLLVANDFVQALRHAEVNLSSGPLRVRAITNRMPSARLGLVVPKRGNPLAVRRNRIKRIVRDTFRHEVRGLPRVDLVVQVHGQLSDEELRRRLSKLLTRMTREIESAGEHSRGADGSHE